MSSLLQRVSATVAACAALPGAAAELQLSFEIPAPNSPRWHKPYVAVWVERAADQSFAANLALWYDLRKRNNAGAKWLNDLRAWWRASGSQLELPADGITGATRGAGEHVLSLGSHPGLRGLAPGAYEVVVEVSREHGGHDLVRLPLQWPPRAAQQQQAPGGGEVRSVKLVATP